MIDLEAFQRARALLVVAEVERLHGGMSVWRVRVQGLGFGFWGSGCGDYQS